MSDRARMQLPPSVDRGLHTGAPACREPFSDVTTVADYVPRRATEAVLDGMANAVVAGVPALVTGPPGMGKTLILRQLGERLRPDYHSVFLPYPSLTPDDMGAWILTLLGGSGAETTGWLFDVYLEHCADTGQKLLLLVDDAGSIPPETAGWLKERVGDAAGPLRLAFAGIEHPDDGDLVLPRLDAWRAVLAEPMSASEARDYVASELARAGLRLGEEPWSEPVLSFLHQVSEGVPRRLNTAASLILWGLSVEQVALRMKDEWT